MIVLDEGHWEEPRSSRSGEARDPGPTTISDSTVISEQAVWIGQAVACTTFTCGFRFILQASEAELVEARQQPDRAPDTPLRFTVRCPRCRLTTDLFVPAPSEGADTSTL